MDDQNNNLGGTTPSEGATSDVPPTPTQSEPTQEPATSTSGPQPQPEQKCVTCGNAASGGSCVACGQGEITCTCGPAQGGPASPIGEQSPSQPVV